MRQHSIQSALDDDILLTYVFKYDYYTQGKKILDHQMANYTNWMTILPDGRVACRTVYNILKIFDGEGYTFLRANNTNISLTHIKVLSDKRIIGFYDTSFFIWSDNLDQPDTQDYIDTPPDKVFITQDDHIITIRPFIMEEWDLEGNLLFEQKEYLGISCVVKVSPGKFLIGLENGDIHITCKGIFSAHGSEVTSITLLPNGHFISTGHHDAVIWKETNRINIEGHTGSVRKVVVTPHTFITLSNEIKVWNFEAHCLYTIDIECVDMALLLNNDLITASLSNIVRVWIKTNCIKAWMQNIDDNSHIVISDDKILIGGADTVIMWQ